MKENFHKGYFILMVALFLSSGCKEIIAPGDRPVGEYSYDLITGFNAKLAIHSYKKDGSTAGGNMIDQTANGKILIKRNDITFEYGNSDFDVLSNHTIKYPILECYKKGIKNGITEYRYKCNGSIVGVEFDSEGKVYHVNLELGDDTIGFFNRNKE
ncbi:MAG: hypothetical protein J5I59_07800 [Saprospiraceae bacterium]|nr:hypothetical protein [Saprospiraceae bacterium]